MENGERLREGRNLLLKLHKNLVDHERALWEGMNGRATAGEFLNALLEDPDLSWLRKFSTLIVDIDEMFAQRDGFSADTIEAHFETLRALVTMNIDDEAFKAKYQAALQQDPEAAARQADLKLFLNSTD
jgi:hypothetical protein